MVKYKAPLREYEFILREVLGIEKELGSILSIAKLHGI